jgi:hypothetical protein
MSNSFLISHKARLIEDLDSYITRSSITLLPYPLSIAKVMSSLLFHLDIINAVPIIEDGAVPEPAEVHKPSLTVGTRSRKSIGRGLRGKQL